jgi:hypothetical protein
VVLEKVGWTDLVKNEEVFCRVKEENGTLYKIKKEEG